MLTQNALATMYGPEFLLLYVCVIAVVCVACAWAIGRLDTSSAEGLPLIPPHPDPLEIAYLRGGENEVTRVAIFDLIERGYLELREEKIGLFKTGKIKRIAQALNAPDASVLPPQQQTVFGQFRTPQTAQEVFQSALPTRIKSHCVMYEQSLREAGLLCDGARQREAAQYGWIGAAVVLGLGGYKLWAALATGHDNVIFLILLALFSAIVIPILCRKRRLSRRGKAYVDRLQQAFAPLKGRPADSSVLLVSVFGVAALAGTSQEYYAQMFAQSSSSGGCGGGSSGGCGSGGCGGGGGGGCGGCGGGG